MNKFLQTTLLAFAILLASVFSVLAKKTGDPVGKKATEPTEPIVKTK